ncbi:MAG: hypothetical protein L0Y44_03395, partial [Phycisphaerales bacterium]|nr:hypothetical protein [Phycisphaerales bacterium]MCI0629681.1 hypothetical protein [Phycisphaerales bacterium]MCI0674437.1 hypothetical protein [Phycisphaerales bacterium]
MTKRTRLTDSTQSTRRLLLNVAMIGVLGAAVLIVVAWDRIPVGASNAYGGNQVQGKPTSIFDLIAMKPDELARTDIAIKN